MASFFLVLFFLFFHPAGAIIFMSEKISAIPFFWWQDVYGIKFLSDIRGAFWASLFSETTVFVVIKFLTYYFGKKKFMKSPSK